MGNYQQHRSDVPPQQSVDQEPKYGKQQQGQQQDPRQCQQQDSHQAYQPSQQQAQTQGIPQWSQPSQYQQQYSSQYPPQYPNYPQNQPPYQYPQQYGFQDGNSFNQPGFANYPPDNRPLNKQKNGNGFFVAACIFTVIFFLIMLGLVLCYTADTSNIDTSSNEMAPLGMVVIMIFLQPVAFISFFVALINIFLSFFKTINRQFRFGSAICLIILVVCALMLPLVMICTQ